MQRQEALLLAGLRHRQRLLSNLHTVTLPSERSSGTLMSTLTTACAVGPWGLLNFFFGGDVLLRKLSNSPNMTCLDGTHLGCNICNALCQHAYIRAKAVALSVSTTSGLGNGFTLSGLAADGFRPY